jgi:hypothetical protein
MRQKAKIAGMEGQVEELNQQLQQAHTENNSLKKLNNILEQVLNLRDEHINGLQKAAPLLNQASSGSKRGSLEISGEVEEQPGALLISTCLGTGPMHCCLTPPSPLLHDMLMYNAVVQHDKATGSGDLLLCCLAQQSGCRPAARNWSELDTLPLLLLQALPSLCSRAARCRTTTRRARWCLSTSPPTSSRP